MLKPLLGGLLAATILAAPSFAQAVDPTTGRSDAAEAARGYVGVPSSNQAAVDAQQAPVTAALNTAGAAVADVDTAGNAANQAQYDADRAAYINALVQHDHAVDRTDARYARQQRAYADAMAVWRVQAAACKKGDRKACNLPAPNVADYY